MTALARGTGGSGQFVSTEVKPFAAPLLVALGGILILFEGIVFGELVLVIAGLFLWAFALLVRHEPHHHLANGIAVLLFVFLSFIFGSGGFVLGGLLAGAGAILSILWTPRVVVVGSFPRQ